MSSRRYSLAFFSVLFAVSTSCSNPFTSDWEEVVGLVDETMAERGEVLELPSDGVVGAGVSIRVITGGSGSCTRISRTPVEWENAGSLLITPYHDSKWGDAVCTADFHFFFHTVTVRFPASRTYTVRVRARWLRSDAVSIVATDSIVVR